MIESLTAIKNENSQCKYSQLQAITYMYNILIELKKKYNRLHLFQRVLKKLPSEQKNDERTEDDKSQLSSTSSTEVMTLDSGQISRDDQTQSPHPPSEATGDTHNSEDIFVNKEKEEGEQVQKLSKSLMH